MNLKRFLTLVSFATLAAGVLPLFAQGLGDVAKKEEERRKGIAAPAKVYTNKDLTAAPESSSLPAVPPSAGSTAPAPGAATTPIRTRRKRRKTRPR